MTSNIRWGIISTAGINRALLDPIRHAARSELAAVASRDAARAQAYAQEQNIPKSYGSYEELLDDPDIDAVYNPLPNSMHCEWTVKAAEAGKHVLCEKPLVTNITDFAKVEAAANANNVTIFEAFMYLHHPQTRQVLEMIRAGKIGQPQQINSWFQFYLPAERATNIRLRADVEGGTMWDVGVYPNSLSIVMADAGAPTSVWAQQIVGESGVDVSMRAQMTFSNSVVSQIVSSFRTPFREGAHIDGDEGSLYIREPWKPGVTGNDSTVILSRVVERPKKL